MENTFNCITNRRSIRKYTDKMIPDDLVHKLLEAGMSAPSACNQQPWHFVLITDKDVLKKLYIIYSGNEFLNDAALAIIVCGDTSSLVLEHFWPQDCAAATENILVAAEASGLGAVWLGLYPNDDLVDRVRELLNAPKHVSPFSVISMGYPAEVKVTTSRYSKDKVHYHTW